MAETSAQKAPLIDLDSRIGELWEHPLGRDVLAKILMQAGLPRSLVTNPLGRRLRLRTLARIGSRFGAGRELFDSLTALLNTNRDLPGPACRGTEEHWWKTAVFYQIYPRSFADSNGDGIGDIPGIISRLDYLQELGIDALWLCPVYDSPNDDNGYDIRDYQKIMTEFGDLEDLDRLIAELHDRGMRLIMDLVINHTSDEHPWFQAALNDPDSKYRDYYFFRPGRTSAVPATSAADEGAAAAPPNNWVSFFSGPAWRHYPERDEWAMHLFSAKQMDLNWEHAPMRQELYEMVRWWLDRGVDGFRLDVINYISKPPTLPDGDEFIGDLMEFTGIEHYFVGPRLHEHLAELRREAFRPGTVAVGETPGVGINLAKLLTQPERKELDMVFTFDHLETPGHTRFDDYRYDLEFLRDYLTEYITDYGATGHTALFYENHDNPRMISKVDPRPEHRRTLGRLLALIQLTLPGTPFIYQGQELGAVNEPFTQISELRDVESLNRYLELIGTGLSPQEAFAQILPGTRDHARTPMAWDAGGGFTTGTPWLPSPASARVNVQDSLADPTSVLVGYRELIALRRAHPLLATGGVVFGPRARGRWRYVRMDDDGTAAFRVEVNLTDSPRAFTEPGAGWDLVFSTGGTATHDPAARSLLGPYDGRLYQRRA